VPAASEKTLAGNLLDSTAVALADPVFSFDQTAFDAFAAAKGFPALPLDQFFTLEFSPGLSDLGAGNSGGTVPEPATPCLLSVGLVGVMPIRFRRRQCRRLDHRTPVPF